MRGMQLDVEDPRAVDAFAAYIQEQFPRCRRRSAPGRDDFRARGAARRSGAARGDERSGSGTVVETWNQEVTDTTAEVPGVTEDSAR